MNLGVRTSIVAALVTAGFAEETFAQAPGLDEITVTARRRDESVMKVPVTVTAVSSEVLVAQGITGLTGIADITPSFTVTNTGGTNSGRQAQGVYIRGIRAASVFIDGAPVAAGLLEGLDDAERMEVLRGPQSAYFGRATFSGAINAIPKTPSMQKFAGKISGQLGNYGTEDLRASLEGPVIEDKLAVRLSGRVQERDGHYRNNGIGSERLGDQDTKSITVALYAKPIEPLSIKLYANQWDASDGPSPLAKYGPSDFNCNANKLNPSGPLNYVCGTLPDYPDSRLAQDVIIDELFTRTILNNSTGVLAPVFNRNYPYIDHGGLEMHVRHVHLKVDYQIERFNATVSYLAAKNATHRSIIIDQSVEASTNQPNPNFGVLPNTEPYRNWILHGQSRVEDESHELRFTSDQQKRFRWAAGASYVFQLSQANASTLQFTGPIRNSFGEPSKTNTLGGFFGASYDIVPKLTLDLEGRYQIDEVALFNRTLADVQTLRVENKFKNFVPRVNLSFRPLDTTMIYASFAKGVNPGAFNAQLLTAPQFQLDLFRELNVSLVVKPEKLDNYELGWKQRFWDNKAQIAAAVYYAQWSDQIIDQRVLVPQPDAQGNPTSVIGLLTVRTNLGKTTIKGFELEAVVAPTEAISLNAMVAMNDSKLDQFNCITCAAFIGDPNVQGKELPQYNKWSGALGARYTRPFKTDGEWYARTDYVYRSGQWESFANLAKTPPVHRVNLRTGVELEKYDFEAYVLNVFDNKSVIDPDTGTDVLSPGLSQRAVTTGMPLKREYGIRGTYRF